MFKSPQRFIFTGLLTLLLLPACKKGGSQAPAGSGSAAPVAVGTTGSGSSAPQTIVPPPPTASPSLDPSTVQRSSLRLPADEEEEETAFPGKLLKQAGSVFRRR